MTTATRRICLARRQHAVGRDPVPGEGPDQEPAERLVADLAQHRRPAAKPRDANRDIARRSAGLGNEAPRADLAQRRHEIDDELANATTSKPRRGAMITQAPDSVSNRIEA